EGPEHKLTKGELGHLKKAGAGPLRTLVEFRDPDAEHAVGDVLTVEQFEPGQRVKVSGVAVGKGFQGTIRRHNFGRGPVSHGSHNVRAPGSIGASADPARVFKGMRMPGRMGGRRVTQRRLEVVKVDRKARRRALRAALSVHAARGSIAVLDPSGIDEPATKQAAQWLDKWGARTPTLVVLDAEEVAALKSFRNLPDVDVVQASEV